LAALSRLAMGSPLPARSALPKASNKRAETMRIEGTGH
jgi:hypothetical protein